jgi:hypothetical protein
MCTSTVILFYGVWVKTWSLVFAAKAYKKAASALLAIDIILRRRRTGQLSVKERLKKRKNAMDLPEEIWSIIKQSVIDEALEDAEESVLSQNRCQGCNVALGESSVGDGSDLEDSQPKPLNKVLTQWDKPVCEECLDLLEFEGTFCDLDVDEKVRERECPSSRPHSSHSALFNRWSTLSSIDSGSASPTTSSAKTT